MSLITNDPGKQNIRKINRAGGLYKPYGRQPGPELLTNPDFNAAGVGWNEVIAVADFSVGNVRLQGSLSSCEQSFTTIIGKFYRVTSSYSSAALVTGQCVASNTASLVGAIERAVFNANGTKTFQFQATAVTTFIYLQNGTTAPPGTECFFNFASVKELL